MYNNSDVDNQINKILKGSTPIDKLQESEKKPIKKKRYIKTESTEYESEDTPPIKPKKRKYKIDIDRIKEAGLLLVLFVLVSSKQSITLCGSYIKLLGLDDNKDQFILGIISRGLILVLVYYWYKLYIKN